MWFLLLLFLPFTIRVLLCGPGHMMSWMGVLLYNYLLSFSGPNVFKARACLSLLSSSHVARHNDFHMVGSVSTYWRMWLSWATWFSELLHCVRRVRAENVPTHLRFSEWALLLFKALFSDVIIAGSFCVFTLDIVKQFILCAWSALFKSLWISV